ncbi:MAG: MBL fold metallo-hydrolase [Qingshengfaniella sp.]
MQSLAYRFRLGRFEMTTLLAGTLTRPDPHGIFGVNATAEDFGQVSRENFIPTDRTQFFYTPLLVNTGSERILFDTGTDTDSTAAAMAEAGYHPDQVDKIVLTHMHGDHVGGLIKNGAPGFSNATLLAGRIENEYWTGTGAEAYDTRVAPLADRMTLIEDGDQVAEGIHALLAPGHTPGHMAFRFESDGAVLLHFADLANHYVWSLGRPDWQVRFDVDKVLATQTRRKTLGMIADQRILAIGYHMPFPALGHVARDGDGFRWVPVSYQMMLD